MPTDYAIKDGRTVFDATTYTGNGAASRSVTNAGSFKPDFVWYKDRSNGTYWHGLFDSVRGAGKFLASNQTGAESTTTDRLLSFDATGFTVGSDVGANANGDSYVAWQWQAGQGTTSSNTSGSITSTVSVNASAGFSIVTWTGTGANATVGHGLGVAPKLFITKNRAVGTTDWLVYHASLGATNYVRLNLNNASAASAIAFNNTAPTSSVFSVGTWDTGNGNGNAMVTYCWAEVAGFSKFGSYVGTGDTNGAFVYTGFRPKYIMIKSSSNATEWMILDAARNTYNVVSNRLQANASSAEDIPSASAYLDFLSNGFKIKHPYMNDTGWTFIYVCFAEHPFKYANAR